VVEGSASPPFAGVRRIDVRAMVEKPSRPRSHWAATAVYAFGPAIWKVLRERARRSDSGELEVTDGIAALLASGGRISALVLDPAVGLWKSVGSPEGYAAALRVSRTLALRAHPNP
jgi:dTDP-glucose pyrophosphorylase